MTDHTPRHSPHHIPIELSQATLEARARAEDRAARAGGVHPNPGQLWTRKADGVTMQLAGMKGNEVRTTCVMVDTSGENYVEVDIDTLVDDWTHAGCNHDAACCPTHGTHTMPHMGCILR